MGNLKEEVLEHDKPSEYYEVSDGCQSEDRTAPD